MDIGQIILHGLKDLTKRKPKLRGEAMKEHRGLVRHRNLDERRNLCLEQYHDNQQQPQDLKNEFKPSIRNKPSAANIPSATNKPPVTNKPSRLELLKIWKKDRDELVKKQKANAKPIFKVSRVVANEPLESIYSHIKGKKLPVKPLPPSTTKAVGLTQGNYQFKAPSNVKPIDLKKTNLNRPIEKGKTINKKLDFKSEKLTEKRKLVKNVPEKVSHKYNTRSRVKIEKPTTVKIDVKEEKKQMAQCNESSLLMSPDFPINVQNETIEAITSKTDFPIPECKTPESNVYVSPFVTLSRGKDSARKEYQKRSLVGGYSCLSPEATGPVAAANYFRNLLDEEIERIQSICNKWRSYKDEENPPEEACDMIDMAIGQSNLLISKRMQQFRGLIDSCEAQNSVPLITNRDLHGFWDLLVIQVRNLELRFENIEKLRANSWEEIISVERKVAPKKKKRTVKKTAGASSSIRDAINAARKAAKENANPNNLNVKNFDGGFFSVNSPRKDFTVTTSGKDIPSRNSPFQNVLRTRIDNNRESETSPSVAMMKVSCLAKNWNVTPAKDILKVSSKSTAKKCKSVMFVEDVEESSRSTGALPKASSTPEYRFLEVPRTLTKTKLFD